VRVVVAGDVRTGDAVDLSDRDLDPDAVVAAVRKPATTVNGTDTPDLTPLRVRCGTPGPVHDHVGLVSRDATLSVRVTLAAVARARGETAPQDAEIERVRAALADTSPHPAEFGRERRAVAEAGADEDALRERVASLRGRIGALESADADADRIESVRADLVEAAADLSRVQTERIAATQRLRAADRGARTAWDERERRLRLQDRLGNLERAARAALAARVYDDFAAAVRAAPPAADADHHPVPGDEPGDYEGDTVTATLAVARVAPLEAPVVLAAGRFSGATAAATWLDAPAIRL
jgi:hypothetical protein